MFEFLDLVSQIVGLIAGIVSFCPTKLRKAMLRSAAACWPPLNRFLVLVLLTSILLLLPAPDMPSVTLSITGSVSGQVTIA
ncbi:hypothetical protein [Brevundimonas sp.]|uniref:hypothetical protein n=1 Tax=Brevundimonas sp. TaxID=1871086 RepID=UPI002E0DA377|nr:hypothetical protein [Brevundimonas sp.]